MYPVRAYMTRVVLSGFLGTDWRPEQLADEERERKPICSLPKFAGGATYGQPCDGSEVVEPFQAFAPAAPAARNWDHLALATSLGGCSRLANQRIPWLTACTPPMTRPIKASRATHAHEYRPDYERARLELNFFVLLERCHGPASSSWHGPC